MKITWARDIKAPQDSLPAKWYTAVGVEDKLCNERCNNRNEVFKNPIFFCLISSPALICSCCCIIFSNFSSRLNVNESSVDVVPRSERERVEVSAVSEWLRWTDEGFCLLRMIHTCSSLNNLNGLAVYISVICCGDVAGCRTHSRAVNATMVANSARARGESKVVR